MNAREDRTSAPGGPFAFAEAGRARLELDPTSPLSGSAPHQGRGEPAAALDPTLDGVRAPLLAHASQSPMAGSLADSAAQPEAAAPHPAAPPHEEDNDSAAGEIGRSSARITVGDGDDRVALWIGVAGDSVRVEARAHSAAYADALHRRADELAAGLADRGLMLGSLSADVHRDSAPRPDPGQPEQHADRHEPSREDRTDPQPTHPRPRGLRAIA